MRRFRAIFASIPRLVIALTAVHMIIGVAAAIAWQLTGDLAFVDGFFHYQGALFLVTASVAELCLSWYCCRQFAHGEGLRLAWFLITLSAAAHAMGSILSQLLGVRSYLNPLVYYNPLKAQLVAEPLRQAGLIIGGPLEMALLAGGLALVLRAYRRLGMLSWLKRSDWLLISIACVYTVSEAWHVVAAFRAGKVMNAFEVMSWPSDPLLILLFAEAIWIRRSLLNMGWGMIARCWGAFAVAIGFTVLGDIGLWAAWSGLLPWPVNSIAWYVWFLAAAAYVLGPAHQMEAFRLVRADRDESRTRCAA